MCSSCQFSKRSSLHRSTSTITILPTLSPQARAIMVQYAEPVQTRREITRKNKFRQSTIHNNYQPPAKLPLLTWLIQTNVVPFWQMVHKLFVKA